jgi:hypothetical protein
VAANAARRALASDEATLIDLSMLHVVAETLDGADLLEPPMAATAGHDGSWWLETADAVVRVARPRRRRPE